MDVERLKYFRKILQEQLRHHNENIRSEQALALEANDERVKDNVDQSLMDVNKELAFRLGERESQMVAEIDEALRRIDEGTYGECERCGQSINERRLEAIPTARYDATCQAAIEAEREENMPTL
jgi:DnaK suppressor protein